MVDEIPQPKKRSWSEAFRLYWQAKESSALKAGVRRFLLSATATLSVTGILDEFMGGWAFGLVDDLPWIFLVILVFCRVNHYRTSKSAVKIVSKENR